MFAELASNFAAKLPRSGRIYDHFGKHLFVFRYPLKATSQVADVIMQINHAQPVQFDRAPAKARTQKMPDLARMPANGALGETLAVKQMLSILINDDIELL